MINVNDTIKSAYRSDGYLGNVSFTIGSSSYNERNILANSTKITESISSGENIDFRAVEKSCLETTLINITENIKELKGKTLTMKQTVLNTDIPLGVYTIVDAVNDGDYLYDITAYDNLYKFDVDVSEWWNEEVEFPISLRNLLISLCNKVGVSYDLPETFTNSDFMVQQNTYVENVLATEFLGYIQEVCAGFIKPDRLGVMRFIQLIYLNDNGLYPALDLYPSEDLYPISEYDASGADPSALYNVPMTISTLQIADYTVTPITTLQIKGTSSDVGIIVGEGDTPYIIEANPLLYSFTGSASDNDVAYEILNILSEISYIPVSTKVKALPYIEVGDLIRFVSHEGKEAYAPLLSRTISGFLLNTDQIDIKGSEIRPAVSISSNKNVRILNQHLHEYENSLTELRSTISEVSSEITDLGAEITRTESSIDQLANSITLIVSQSIVDYMSEEGIDQFIEDAKMTFQFTIDGLSIAKTNTDGTIVADYKTVVTNDGLRVINTETNAPSLISEKDSVTANNLTADQYLRVRANQVASRFQQFYSTAHSEYEFGIFWEVV